MFSVENFKTKLENIRPSSFDLNNVVYKGINRLVKIKCLRCNNMCEKTPLILYRRDIEECCDFCCEDNPSQRRIIYDYEDYVNVCESLDLKYLSDDIPKNTTSIGGVYECQNQHVWKTTSLQYLLNGYGCPHCTHTKKPSLQEYQTSCGNKGYFCDTVPSDIYIKVKWICYFCENDYYANLNDVKAGLWCNCIPKSPRSPRTPKSLNNFSSSSPRTPTRDSPYQFISSSPHSQANTPKNTPKPISISPKPITNVQCEECGRNNLKFGDTRIRGGRCFCKLNSSESKLEKILNDKYENILHAFTPKWTSYKNITYDFLIGNIIIEIQKNDIEGHYRRLFKSKIAIQNGYYVINVQENLINNDIDNLVPNMCDQITKIRNNFYAEPVVINI